MMLLLGKQSYTLTIVHDLKGNFGHFEGGQNSGGIQAGGGGGKGSVMAFLPLIKALLIMM